MPALPESWKLSEKPRPDGRVDLIGKDDTGAEYVARTTEESGVTDRDLQILSLGNREQSTARDVVKFFEDDRKRVDKETADKMAGEYEEAADQVVFAGFHGQRQIGGYQGRAAENFENWLKSLQEN
jgi:hypothetical protein